MNTMNTMTAISRRLSQSMRMMRKARPQTAASREWKAAMIQRLEVEQIYVTSLDGEQAGLVALVDFAIRHDRRALYANMLISMYQNPHNLREALSAASRSRLWEWLDVPACESVEVDEMRRMFWTADLRALTAVKARLLEEFEFECEPADYDYDMPF